jgi:hypothetical protein
MGHFSTTDRIETDSLRQTQSSWDQLKTGVGLALLLDPPGNQTFFYRVAQRVVQLRHFNRDCHRRRPRSFSSGPRHLALRAEARRRTVLAVEFGAFVIEYKLL